MMPMEVTPEYILQESGSYQICLEIDSLTTQPTHSPSRISNETSAPLISETSQSQEKVATLCTLYWMLNRCLHQKA